ncbi:DUF5071 domain-containing protein [Paenibacillus humicola]|uniref:DUF5071 domain-containing protein n=1 Tax=Paenibacillus humicola TaxID=3110540 RepID=UPI00237B6620|nr:DUF5071 domain-containing protein [Paenibacillus humicola]
MDVRELIPKHKHDFDRTKELKKLDKDTIRPIIAELLVWLQDGNWPVATEIRDILLPFNQELVPHIKTILQTNDGEWKFFLLTVLVRELPPTTVSELRQDLIDIAYNHNPSKSDRASEVDEISIELLKMLDDSNAVDA